MTARQYHANRNMDLRFLAIAKWLRTAAAMDARDAEYERMVKRAVGFQRGRVIRAQMQLAAIGLK